MHPDHSLKTDPPQHPLTFSFPVLLLLLLSPASLSAFPLLAIGPGFRTAAILSRRGLGLPFDPALPAFWALLATRPRDEARSLARETGHGRALGAVAGYVSVLKE